MRSLTLWLVLLGSLGCGGVYATGEPIDPAQVPVMQDAVGNAAASYASAWLSGDSARMIALLDSKWVRANGGPRALGEELTVQFARDQLIIMSPETLQLGTPNLIATEGNLYAVVAARTFTKGFPRNVEGKRYFAAVSNNQGKTWSLIDTSCSVAVRRVFKDFPVDQIAGVLHAPFSAVRTIANSVDAVRAPAPIAGALNKTFP